MENSGVRPSEDVAAPCPDVEERRWLNFSWLVLLVITFVVILTFDHWKVLWYSTSLLLWLLPIVILVPAFWTVTAQGSGRRRRALLGTIAFILVLGVALDFVLGSLTLHFPLACAARPFDGGYVYCLPARGGFIPVEEIVFYAAGPAAMVLVYACCDEYWLSRYNPPDTPVDIALIQVSQRLVVVAAVGISVAFVFWLSKGRFPTYYAFLLGVALLPAMFLYRAIHTAVNWPAFAITSLYVILTSVIWEVTLAIPRGWWEYNPAGMLGIWVPAWSAGPDKGFPLEAAFVWICAPFSAVLSYEFAKALTHSRHDTKTALFGK